MEIFLLILAVLMLVVLLTAYICFRMAFYVKRDKEENLEEFTFPHGEIYEPYHDKMLIWMKEARTLVTEEADIKSFDGLNLHGRYYECKEGATIELLFHGYRGSAERDLCGGVQRCFKLGRNAFIVDQRTSGKSGGKVISFGINESRDLEKWVDYLIERFGKDVKIIISGISMGAATVMIAAGRHLPKNVVGVLADCGYTSAKEIIKQEIRKMKLPADLLYPFVKLGAKIFGHFDLEETSPIEAMKNCRLPIIFFHGESDDYVPCYMSEQNFAACAASKRLVTVKDAGHGLSYMLEPDGYLASIEEFFNQNGIPTEVVKK
ncbi:MAG: alpha/beta hydrolase [Oscillospiraceae bacterium]|nr:alpha/beta hydrolase [Oscillospiraceae bacterium]